MGRGADHRWELGSVVVYNSATHTSVVRTDSGRPLQDVPQMKSTSGSFDHLLTGTTVVISWDLGFPVIIGCIDMVGPHQTALPSPTLTGLSNIGSNDPTQPTEGSNNYKPPNAPNDMAGGDWAHMGTLGNHVAVLEGGISLLGCPTAHVQSIGPSGTLRTIARRLENITDFGQFKIENDQGRTSLILRAGSNQTTQTGADEQHWTIRLDLGATGDILDFKIQEPQGKLLFRLHAGSDGRVQIYGDGGVDISSGINGTADMRHDIAGAHTTNIASDCTHAVQGNKTTTVDGSTQATTAGDETHSIGGDHTHYASGNRSSGTAGDSVVVVGGKHKLKTGDDAARDIDGAIDDSASKDIKISAGTSLDLVSNAQTKLDGNSIIIGSSGSHPLPKFDTFLQDLVMFITDLTSAISNLIPSNPINLALSVAKMQIFSVKAGIMLPYISLKARND